MIKVLVAEDDLGFREMVSEVLRDGGYKVVAAPDGQAAWERLVAEGADMAVLDLNMPRLNGLELTKKIRADARFSDMPIALLTVRELLDDKVMGYERGADDYITKPFDNNMLLARLKVLERRFLKGK